MDHSAEIGRTITADALNKIVFGSAGQGDVFLVGGYIRDILLGRPGKDYDYVVKGPVEPAVRKIAVNAGGRIAAIGKRGLLRIILKEGGTMDFSSIADNIKADLSGRDYTLNAMAWSPETGLVDPFGGAADIMKRRIRMVSRKNIRSDPLRILRAYRLALELHFIIEGGTRDSMRAFGPSLAEAKSERITLEFFRILNADDASRVLSEMLQDKVMMQVIKSSFNVLEERVHVVSRIEETLDGLPLKFRLMLQDEVSQGLSGKGLLKLGALLENLPENRLAIGNRIGKRLHCLQKARNKAALQEGLSREVLFDVLRTAGKSSPDFLIIEGLSGRLDEYERFTRVWKEGVISAEEVRDSAGVQEGRLLGRMIATVKKAEFLGTVSTKEDALSLVRKSLSTLT